MKATKDPGKKVIRAELERIVNSPDFDTSVRSREFLRFVVEETLAGRESAISQHAIGTMVFGRGSDFDPTTDPIVRMQAGRVRRSLERYYYTAGVEDRVTIEIPKGTYVPVFRYDESVQHTSSDDEAGSTETEEESDFDSWPTVLVKPFHNLTGDKELDFIAQGLASDLAIELDRYQEVRVFLAATHAETNSDPRARFAVEGNISAVGDTLKISVRLVDGDTQQQMWGNQYRYKRSDPNLGVFMDEMAQTLAATVAEEKGVLFRHLSQRSSSRQAMEHGAYEAILRYLHFDVSPSWSSFHEALAALRRAVDVEPNCGLCWTFLARIYATNYAHELTDEDTPIEDALQFAVNGVQLEPADKRARLTLAYVLLLNDELEAGRRETETVLSVNPNNLFYLDGIGYLLTLLGDWDRGPALSRRAVRLNPYHRDIVHAGLWVEAIHRLEYESAYHEAMAFAVSGSFWQPLMRAVALAHLGRMEKAEYFASHLLKLKPNFRARGHWLITRYVKFEDLVGRITEGLEKAGLSLD